MCFTNQDKQSLKTVTYSTLSIYVMSLIWFPSSPQYCFKAICSFPCIIFPWVESLQQSPVIIDNVGQNEGKKVAWSLKKPAQNSSKSSFWFSHQFHAHHKTRHLNSWKFKKTSKFFLVYFKSCWLSNSLTHIIGIFGNQIYVAKYFAT